jgi:hypothetical protein
MTDDGAWSFQALGERVVAESARWPNCPLVFELSR